MKAKLLIKPNMKWLISLGMVTVAMLLSTAAFAQNTSTVSGTVTDQTAGEPLPGVNISVQGTTSGTTTNAEGQFELNVSSLSDTLRFTFIGYEPAVVPIQGRTTINIQMQPTTISGSELVVVGYGTQEKRDLTGSVSVVDMDEFNQQSSNQITKQLQGQASGITVVSSGQPGESPDIRIRGINTFGNNSPLYVVDGVPTQSIDDLNSNDIASMQVLKDAAAASIYGSRAANGVIIITTKQGQGDIQVDYSASYGYDVPPSGNVWNTLSPQGMAELEWMTSRNSGEEPDHDQYGSGDNPRLPDYILPAGAMADDVDESSYYVIPEYNDPAMVNNFNQIIRANKEGTNWFDEVFDPAGTMTHDLSVSGGGETGNYLFSLNYLDQEGTLMESYRERYTIRANTKFNVNDNIRIGENLSYSVSENPQITTLVEGSAIGMSYRQQPIIPVYDIAGNFAGTNAPSLGNARNPVALAYRTRNNKSTDTRLFGNVFAEVDILDNLMVRTSFGGELFSGNSRSFAYPEYENVENNTTNSFSANSYSGHNWTWTNTLNYEQLFAEQHQVEVTLGTELYRNQGRDLGGSTSGYFSFDPDYTNLSSGSGTQTNNSSYYEDALVSFFGRLDYDFDDRYILSATLRRDGSSRFLENQWGWFPAGSVGWRVSEENFMQDADWLSDFKVRVGYGIMGNQLNVAPDNPYTLFAGDQFTSYYPIGGSNSEIQQGFERSRIGNPNAKWEKNITTNIGFDATLFNDRLEIAAEYYWKDVEDLLYNPELVGTAGTATQPFVNIGNMRNQGVDASVRTFGTISEDWQYNIGLTFTTYQNEILNISDATNYFDEETRRFEGSSIVRNQVGQAVSSFYGYQIDGFWDDEQEVAAANEEARQVTGNPEATFQENIGIGRFRYEDLNDDGQITAADRTFLGNPNPEFTYGLNFGLNYKQWDFSMFLYGSQGNDIWNMVKWYTDFYPSFAGAKSETALHDSWTEDNTDAKVAIQEDEGNFSTNGVPNSYYVEDGSYFRLKNVRLGYSIPNEALENIGLRDVRIYVQGENLFTITNYSGLDPEVGFSPADGEGGSSTSFGIDEGAYPTPQRFMIGINISY